MSVAGQGGIIDWIQIFGHLSIDVVSVAIYLVSGGLIKGLQMVANTVFGKPSLDANWRKLEGPYQPRYSIEGGPVYTDAQLFSKRQGEIDVAQTLAKSNYPVPADELVQAAKDLLAGGLGTEDGSLLADDFMFCPPVVAPLGKKDFLRIFGSFALPDAMPDIRENAWNFHVDPLEPNRVWWLSRNKGTHTGNLAFGAGIPPTNKFVEWPVQANSMLFNDKKQCYQLTVGYACDKRIGNTGGLGAVFGLLHAVGKPLPFPEGRPWAPTPPYKLLMRLGALGERFGMGPGMDGKSKKK